ncbi:MAG: ankyrin repeat domain-containing protein [Syntrophobacteraceae bacterium]
MTIIHLITRTVAMILFCWVFLLCASCATPFSAKLDPIDKDLYRAAKRGDLPEVNRLIAKGADVNVVNDKYYNTALMWASFNGRMEVVQALLKKGAYVNTKNINAYTALMAASEHGHLGIVQALVSNGAEVNAKDNGGWPASWYASYRGHMAVAKFLEDASRDAVVGQTTESINMPPLQKGASDLVANDPNNVGFWIEYGRACLLSNNPHGAEMAFLRAIQLDPECQLAYRHLGLILMTLERYEDAEKVYQKALEINPSESGATRTAYGYCLVALGRDEEALSAFRTSCELNADVPSVISAKLGISALLLRRGDTKGAEREYKAAIELDPDIVKILEKQRELSIETSP